ncbi:MAG: C4-dicarboxylate ABC transporter substrate-binding protein, partial [Oscillatoriales cyanobacterium]
LTQAISQAIKYLAIFKGYTQVSQAIHQDEEHLPIE